MGLKIATLVLLVDQGYFPAKTLQPASRNKGSSKRSLSQLVLSSGRPNADGSEVDGPREIEESIFNSYFSLFLAAHSFLGPRAASLDLP